MNISFNWKLVLLQIVALLLVISIDNVWLDLLFLLYVVWDLLRWARRMPSELEIRGYLDTTKSMDGH